MSDFFDVMGIIYNCLKRSYDEISSFLHSCVDKILKVSNTKRYSLSKLRLDHGLHDVYITVWGDCITPPNRIHHEKKAEAIILSWRRCGRCERGNYFVWDPKEDTTRNQCSVIFTTLFQNRTQILERVQRNILCPEAVIVAYTVNTMNGCEHYKVHSLSVSVDSDMSLSCVVVSVSTITNTDMVMFKNSHYNQ